VQQLFHNEIGSVMANFVTHGIVGAAVRMACSCPPDASVDLKVGLIAVGFVLGSLPDTADWVAAKVFKKERWELYTKMHKGLFSIGVGCILWDYGAHLLLDIPFHRIPGENWWPRLWWLDIGSALAAIGAVVLLW
jgi:hypothetical protein